MNDTIAAVVVTFNRKNLLINCLESIRSQTRVPEAIFIIDNLSMDGTPNCLLENKYISELPIIEGNSNQIIRTTISSLHKSNHEIEIIYVRKFKNDGGAGGFYEGMKQSFELGFDWLWLMDDDGIPDSSQLEELISFTTAKKMKYSNALVLDRDNNDRLAFVIKGYNAISDIKEMKFIENYASSFNGTLISREIISDIGMIKREMFIWGDELEYNLRVRKNGYKIGTVISAIHYHPKVRGVKKSILPFGFGKKITLKQEDRDHIYFRNRGYINKIYGNSKIVFYEFILYFVYFLFHFQFKRLVNFVIFYNRGLNCNFREL